MESTSDEKIDKSMVTGGDEPVDIEAVSTLEWTPADEKSLIRKIDIRVSLP